jgi:hypothetical protein
MTCGLIIQVKERPIRDVKCLPLSVNGFQLDGFCVLIWGSL